MRVKSLTAKFVRKTQKSADLACERFQDTKPQKSLKKSCTSLLRILQESSKKSPRLRAGGAEEARPMPRGSEGIRWKARRKAGRLGGRQVGRKAGRKGGRVEGRKGRSEGREERRKGGTKEGSNDGTKGGRETIEPFWSFWVAFAHHPTRNLFSGCWEAGSCPCAVRLGVPLHENHWASSPKTESWSTGEGERTGGVRDCWDRALLALLRSSVFVCWNGVSLVTLSCASLEGENAIRVGGLQTK